MIQTAQIKILLELIHEIVDLKAIWTENNPPIELEPNIFHEVIFLCDKSLLDQKSINLKLTRIENDSIQNQIWTESCWSEHNPTQS